jgi:Putative porin
MEMGIMRKLLVVAVAGALAAGTNLAKSAVSDADFAQLKADFAAMSQRLNALEQENLQLRELSETTVTELELAQTEISKSREARSASSWSERIKWKGDFRYRYENIDVEDRDTRERNRVRARAALVASLPSNTTVGLGVASGGSDPVSSNQTLGSGNDTKDLRLDLAYFTWKATDHIALTAGKYSNPLYKPQKSALLWDGDWRPEGVSATWGGDNLFVNFIGNWLESDTRRDNDEFAWGVQGGTTLALGEAVSLTASLGYYDFPTKGNEPYFDDDFFGNSSVDGVYEYNYEMVEVGADLMLNLFGLPFDLFAHYVQNQDADDYDTGYLAGAKIGKAKDKGSWQLAYQYQDLEADAVLGLLSDSDFAGGGTDGKGHRLSGAYALNKQWKVGFTWFLNNEAGEKNLAEEGGALDYDRFMLDTVFKY